MAANGKHWIFLASSAELRADRDAFRLFVGDLNKRWHDRGVFLEVTVWEDFDDAMSPTRKQDDYNEALRESDLFVMLCWTKVGKYTNEEFEAAHTQFKATGRPLIYTYCKNVAIPTSALNKRDTLSLLDFQERLDTLEHFPTHFDSVAALTGISASNWRSRPRRDSSVKWPRAGCRRVQVHRWSARAASSSTVTTTAPSTPARSTLAAVATSAAR